MNFDPEAVLRQFRETITRWRPGMRVWHRSNGKRGVIIGYVVCADGAIMLQAAYGDGTMNHYPLELSATRIAEDDEADAWRDEPADP